MSTIAGPFAEEARFLNKSARTRARLMDAAVEVFARDGVEAASVNEIARVAEVSNGTFYVHFKDKDEIAAEVAARIAGDIAGQIDAAMQGIDDAIDRYCFATRQFIEFACGEPRWGLMIVRSAWRLQGMRRQMETHLCADLERGRRQGLITAEIDAFLVETIISMVFSALAARLRGDAGPDVGSRISALVLTMLKVPEARAQEAAWRPVVLKTLTVTARPGRKAASLDPEAGPDRG